MSAPVVPSEPLTWWNWSRVVPWRILALGADEHAEATEQTVVLDVLLRATLWLTLTYTASEPPYHDAEYSVGGDVADVP
jgi:hypothetical protein